MCGTCSVGRELLSEIAVSSQCVELVLLVKSLLSEIAESSQCVELVLLAVFSVCGTCSVVRVC